MRYRVLLGWVASAILLSCTKGTGADTAPRPSFQTDGAATTAVSTTGTTDVAAGSGQIEYDEVLASVGVAVDTAPNAAVVLGDAQFCGWDQVGPIRGGNPRVDLDGRRCFVQAHLDGRSAVFLVDARTNEGDPVPGIYRTDGGRVTEFLDSTRDNYGTRAWSFSPCDALYVTSFDAEAPPRLWFTCLPLDEGNQP